ncbi:MAG: DedA family protein [Candidatus Yonathbacteria bacterium]|nr:DedA family protein [Candidatus Yonathbacteria bacterium]
MLEQSIYTFIHFVQDHRFFGYTILFFAMVVEGEVFLIVAGMLARLRALDFGDVLWISFAGVMLGDVLWYGLGILSTRAKSLSFFARAAEKSVLAFLPRFRDRPFSSIFLSKFIYGANHATLVLSGILRVKFELFLRAEFIASFVWVAIFAVTGFMFGHAALAVTHKATQFALIGLGFVVGFILLQRWASKYYEQREREELGTTDEEKDRNA